MSEKKHYLIYQITNNINGKIYIGKHETFNIDDDYFGSGKHLRRAQEKYGLENFTKTILFELQNEEEMNLLEKMVVTEEFCKRNDVYNLNVGGDGGWIYINQTKLNMSGNWKSLGDYSKKIFENTGEWPSEKRMKELRKDSEWSNNYRQKLSNSLKKRYQEFGGTWVGKHHSEETKQKMREQHQKNHLQAGEKNSQFGMIAVYNVETFERATQPKDQPIPKGWEHGRFYNATPEELKQRKILVEKILELDNKSKANIRWKLDKLQKVFDKLLNPKIKISLTKKDVDIRSLEREQKLLEKIQLLNEMYKFYSEFGFKAMVEKYDYKYSSANFVQQCARYVKDFVPQNGKKRGN